MNLIRIAVNNPVAVNILMFAVIFLGIYKGLTITREFFPETDLDRIVIRTPYPGATPEEVEKGITIKIENAIEGVRGVTEITSQSQENFSLVIAKVQHEVDIRRVADDVRTEIDLIRDLPQEAEDSTIQVLFPEIPVISVVVYGDASERRLKRAAEQIKDDLIASPLISRVLIGGVRDEEISIEVRPELLEAYNLTFNEVGMAVRQNNVDIAGGEIKAETGTVLVRTLGEEQTGLGLEEIVLRSDQRGRAVRLSDVAIVKDGFEDSAMRGRFEGKRAMQVVVFKRGNEDAVQISRFVKDYIAERETYFAGDAIKIEYRVDLARFIEQRIALMTKNALQGLVLVFIALAFFLNLRLAFWVGVGLFIAFMGTFVLMDMMEVTINLISLFGIVIVIGLLVDDGIVVAENIFEKMEQGAPSHIAAVEGAEEVARPVLATVTTTIIAFAPLAFIEGIMGDFLGQLPLVVIAALTLSVFEVFLILPSHLAEFGHARIKHGELVEQPERPGFFRRMTDSYNLFKYRLLDEMATNAYISALKVCLHWRYVTISSAIFVGMFTGALMIAGFLPFVFFPKVDADALVAELEMASGTRAEQTEEALAVIADAIMGIPESKGAYTVVGFREEADVQDFPDPAVIGEVIVELYDSDERTRTSEEILNEWRDRVGVIPGAVSLKFRDRAGGPGGPEIEIRVRGTDEDQVERAVRYIKERMSQYVGVRDIEDDAGAGKLELRVRMKPSARALGISQESLARQVRGAFFGFEAQVLQREQEEVKVWVRLDEENRQRITDLLHLRVAAPDGNRIPISEVADIEMVRGVPSIRRVDGLRATTITADVDHDLGNTNEITMSLEEELADIGQLFPGVSLSFEGQIREMAESFGSLAYGFPIALVLIYCVLAILFKSYIQPLMVMAVIPFALIGASLGHLLFGLIPGRPPMPITFLSVIGMVGLSGIVVNNSLIFINFINEARRRHHDSLFDAIVTTGRRRLRPIFLTSITTIFGLGPIMLETSFQAQFLIPMAISISLGLALSTVVTLLVLPCIYMAFEDMRTVVYWLATGEWRVVELSKDTRVEEEQEALS